MSKKGRKRRISRRKFIMFRLKKEEQDRNLKEARRLAGTVNTHPDLLDLIVEQAKHKHRGDGYYQHRPRG